MATRVPPLNKLLAALPPDIYKRLRPSLKLVPLVLGASVYEAGSKQPYVYFPADAIVSLLYVMQDGASAEIAIVGNEGLVGVSLFMGGETTSSRAVVQSAGQAIGCAPSCCSKSLSSRPATALAPALYTGAHHADGADCGLQSPSLH